MPAMKGSMVLKNAEFFGRLFACDGYRIPLDYVPLKNADWKTSLYLLGFDTSSGAVAVGFREGIYYKSPCPTNQRTNLPDITKS